MHYSRLILNSQSRDVRRDLADSFEMHRTVMSAFPGLTERQRSNPDSGSVLWRVDHDRRSGISMLIVQSEMAPDWQRLQERYSDYVASPLGSDLPPISTKERHLTFQPGQRLSFRLRANPTKKLKVEGRKNGKRAGLVTREEQIEWLQRKAADEKLPSGFRLISVVTLIEGQTRTEAPSKVATSAVSGGPAIANPRRPMTHVAVCFEGELEVVDPAAFQRTLCSGIGSAKGFGFGLLSVARG